MVNELMCHLSCKMYFSDIVKCISMILKTIFADELKVGTRSEGPITSVRWGKTHANLWFRRIAWIVIISIFIMVKISSSSIELSLSLSSSSLWLAITGVSFSWTHFNLRFISCKENHKGQLGLKLIWKYQIIKSSEKSFIWMAKHCHRHHFRKKRRRMGLRELLFELLSFHFWRATTILLFDCCQIFQCNSLPKVTSDSKSQICIWAFTLDLPPQTRLRTFTVMLIRPFQTQSHDDRIFLYLCLLFRSGFVCTG